MSKRLMLASALFGALLASPAFSADIPAFQAEQAQVTYDWTGLSVSVHGGLAAGELDNSVALVDPLGVTVIDGSLGQTFGGGLVGAGADYKFQFGSFVLGVAGDASWSEADAVTSIDVGLPIGASGEIVTEMKWLATARGVVGFAMDNVLIYGTGGAAWADLETSVSASGGGLPAGLAFSGGDIAQGWAFGGGVEVGVSENFSIGVEYLYVDLPEEDALNIDIGGGATVQTDTDLDFHTVKAKAAYRF